MTFSFRVSDKGIFFFVSGKGRIISDYEPVICKEKSAKVYARRLAAGIDALGDVLNLFLLKKKLIVCPRMLMAPLFRMLKTRF